MSREVRIHSKVDFKHFFIKVKMEVIYPILDLASVILGELIKGYKPCFHIRRATQRPLEKAISLAFIKGGF